MFHFVKDSLGCSIIASKSTTIRGVLESVAIDLKLRNFRHVVIAFVYRTPGSDLTTFCDNIDRLFYQVTFKNTYICGGFNIDLLNYDSHRGTKYFLDLMFNLCMYPVITKPTRISNASAILIDNIFNNEINRDITSRLLITNISDHLSVLPFVTLIISVAMYDTSVQQMWKISIQ